jgi:MFS family permease
MPRLILSGTRWWLLPYPRYRAARSASMLGSAVSGIAYSLLVLRMGGSATAVGTLLSAWMLTSLACQLPAGLLADLLDRRWLMISADAIRLAVMGSIPVAFALGHLTYAQLLATMVIEAVANAAFAPAATAFLRELVPADRLPRALAQASGFSAAASLLGPPLGGLLYGVAPMLPFIADAASFGLSGALVFSVRARPDRTGDSPASEPRAQPGLVTGPPAGAGQDRRVTAGFRWLLRRPPVMRVLIFAAILNMVAPATLVAVVVVLNRRGVSAEGIGAVLACLGGGGVVGAMLSGRLVRRLAPARLCLIVGCAWTIGLGTFAIAASPWVLGPALVLMMLLSPALGVMLGTITASAAPRHLLGRVSTAEQLLSQSLGAVGPILGGLLLSRAGPTGLWLLLSALCLVSTLSTVGPAVFAPKTPQASPARADAATPS